jgi:Secretory lipase
MTPGRQRGRLALLVAACAVGVGAPQALAAGAEPSWRTACSSSSCPATRALPTLPNADPFYSYPGDLAGLPPGTVLKSRAISLNILAQGPRVEASQVLYRTTDELGQPAATVATVMEPWGATRPTGIVSYQDPYDGLGPQCDPSYNLRAGVTPVDPVVTPKVIGEYLTAGFTVVVPDYEEEQFANDAGQEEGYATLDGIRAAEHHLGTPGASTYHRQRR